MLAYPVVMQQDTNGSLLVTFPVIPEAATNVHEKAQALRMASDALESALEFYFEDGRTRTAPEDRDYIERMFALSALL